jgi:hypothetical protein
MNVKDTKAFEAMQAAMAKLTATTELLATQNAELKKTQHVDHGALWLSDPDKKSDIYGIARCPSCEAKHWIYAKETGHDGVQTSVKGKKLPIYEITFSKAVDAGSTDTADAGQ